MSVYCEDGFHAVCQKMTATENTDQASSFLQKKKKNKKNQIFLDVSQSVKNIMDMKKGYSRTYSAQDGFVFIFPQ